MFDFDNKSDVQITKYLKAQQRSMESKRQKEEPLRKKIVDIFN